MDWITPDQYIEQVKHLERLLPQISNSDAYSGNNQPSFSSQSNFSTFGSGNMDECHLSSNMSVVPNSLAQNINSRNGMLQQSLPIVLSADLAAGRIDNSQRSIIQTNGSIRHLDQMSSFKSNSMVKPMSHYISNEQVETASSHPSSATWQNTLQVPSQHNVAPNNIVNVRQQMLQQHYPSTQASLTYPSNQECRPPSNEAQLIWTKEQNCTIQAAEGASSIHHQPKNMLLNSQQTINIGNMQNSAGFANVQVPVRSSQLTPLLRQSPAPQYLVCKTNLEAKNMWPPKFDSRLPTQPVQCQQSVQSQAHQLQNQHPGLQQQTVHRQEPVCQQPVQHHWQQLGKHPRQLMQHPQQAVQHPQQLAQNHLQAVQRYHQPAQQQPQQQQPQQHQAKFRRILPAGQHQQPRQQQQLVPLQQVPQFEELLNLQRPVQHQEADGYINENVHQQQLLLSDRRDELYAVDHQHHNLPPEHISRAINGYTAGGVLNVATPSHESLGHSNKPSYDPDKNDSHTSHTSNQTQVDIFQYVSQDVQNSSNTRTYQCEQSSKALDNIQFLKSFSVCGPGEMKDHGNEPVGLLVNPTAGATIANNKDLHAVYEDIIETKKRFLNLIKIFKSKRNIYNYLNSKTSTTIPSSSAHEISVPHKYLDNISNVNRTVPNVDLNFPSPPPLKSDGPLYKQNHQMLVNVIERNCMHQPALINEGLCSLENANQVSKGSLAMSSSSLEQHDNHTFKSPTQPINYPGGQHFLSKRNNDSTAAETRQKSEVNKGLPVFEQVTGSSANQEQAKTSKIRAFQEQMENNIRSTGQQSPRAFLLQSNLQAAEFCDTTKVDHNTRNPLLVALLTEEEPKNPCSTQDNDSHRNLKDTEATSNAINLTGCCTKALASNSVTNLTGSELEECKLIPAEIESPFSQMSSATMEELESCFDLWKTPPSNSATQNKRAAYTNEEPQETFSSAGLRDQKCTTSQENVEQTLQVSEPIMATCGANEASLCPEGTALGQKQDTLGSNFIKTIERVAVVNPLVLSKSGCLIKIPASESRKVEMCPVVHEHTLACLLEQKNTLVDASSLLDFRNIPQHPSGDDLPDKLDSAASMKHKNGEIAAGATSSSWLGVNESKMEPLENGGASEPGNVVCQLGCNHVSQTVTLGDCSDTLLEEANGQFHISSICTLVEGSKLYDSKIARIFDTTSSTEVDSRASKGESEILHPVKQLASSTSINADETEKLKLTDVESSNILKPDFSVSHGNRTYCREDVHITESFDNSNASPSEPVNNEHVTNSKYKHSLKQHSEGLEIIAAKKATELDCCCRSAPREREDDHITINENCLDKYAPLADGKINELKHSVKALRSPRDCEFSPDTRKDSEERVSFVADQIHKNVETTKEIDNCSDSSKDKDAEKYTPIAEERISKDSPLTSTPQLEKHDSSFSEEISHKGCTSDTTKGEKEEKESADELLSAQGLDNQLSELLIEFPFGLDRMENKPKLKGKRAIENEVPCKVISAVKHELQLDKRCKISSDICCSEKVVSIDGGSEDRNIKHQKSIDKNVTASLEALGIEKENSLYESLLKHGTEEKKGTLPLDVNCNSSPSLTGGYEAGCFKEGLGKNVITETMELKVHNSIKQEPQSNKECRMYLGICGSKKEDSNICQETNVFTVQKRVDKNFTISLCSENEKFVNQIPNKCDHVTEQSKLLHNNSNSRSLNITDVDKIHSFTRGSEKMEITKKLETQVYSCVKQELQFDKGCMISSRMSSSEKDPACLGAEKSNVTHKKIVEKNILLSLKEIIGCEKENSTNQSFKESNTAEQQSRLLLVESCSKSSLKISDNEAGCPTEDPEKNEVKLEGHNYVNRAPLCSKESRLCPGVPGSKEESSICQELESKSKVQKMDSKFDKKISSPCALVSENENLLDKGLKQYMPQESLLNDELTDVSDSEMGNTSNEIKITLLDSENMTKLFPEIPAVSASDIGMRAPPITKKVSAGPKVKEGLSHSTSEISRLNKSAGGDKKNTSVDKSPCCLYSWVYSLYAYGPKCMCGKAAEKDNTKSDLSTESSRSKCVNTNKAGYSTPTINSNSREQLHCRKTRNEANTLSVDKKGLKRSHSPTVKDVKRIGTVDDLSPVKDQSQLVEQKPSHVSAAWKFDMHKKKSKSENLIKSKNENQRKKSRIKHQPMAIVALAASKMTSKLKDHTSKKDPVKKVLSVPNFAVPEVNQKSCTIDFCDTKTYKELSKEIKKRERLILKGKLTTSTSPRKNKNDKAKCMRLNAVDANGVKLHSKPDKDKEKTCKVLPSIPSLRKEEPRKEVPDSSVSDNDKKTTVSPSNSPRKEEKFSTNNYDKKYKASLGSSPRKEDIFSVSDNDKTSKTSPGNSLRKEGKALVHNDTKCKASRDRSFPRKAEKSPTCDYEKKSRVSPGNSSPRKDKKSSANDKKSKASPGHSPPRKEQCSANDKKCEASPGNSPRKEQCYTNDKKSKASSDICPLKKEQCSPNNNDKKSKASPCNSPPRKEEPFSTNDNDKMRKGSPGNYSSGYEAKSPSNDCEKKSKASLDNSKNDGESFHKNKEYREKINALRANSSKKEQNAFTNNTKSKVSPGSSPFRKGEKSPTDYERKSKTFPSNNSREEANSPGSRERSSKVLSRDEETSTNPDCDKTSRASTGSAFLREEKISPTTDYEKKTKASFPIDEAKYVNTGTRINKSNEKRFSNLEKKSIEKCSGVQKIPGRKEPGPKCVHLDKKEIKFKSHDASAATEEKRTLTIQEYRERRKADRIKAIKKTMAAREAMHQNKAKLPSRSPLPDKTGIMKERFTQSNGSHAQDNMSKSSKTIISNGTTHESLKGSNTDLVQLKSHSPSSKDEGTKNGFLHSALTSKHMNVGKNVTISGKKMLCVINDGNESSKPLGPGNYYNDSSSCSATPITVKNATQKSICPSKLKPGKSSGSEKLKRALSLTIEKKDSVSHVQNNTLSPKMLEFKLCPEVMLRRHSVDGGSIDGNRSESPEKSAVEVIKSKKEDWYNSPIKKKKKVEIHEGDLPESVITNSSTLTPETTTNQNPTLGSHAIFNAFKQRYLEKRSKSLDIGLTK